MKTTLPLLSPNRFCAFIRWLSGNGEGDDEAGREATCIIALQHPDAEKPKNFHAKFYPDLNQHSRAMVNEIAGYILAKHYGLPQPTSACIACIELKNLDFKSINKNHRWIKETARIQPHYYAFCTESMQASTPWLYYGKDAREAMVSDVLEWPDHIKTIAFDDIIANLDRHMNNLLRIGKANYALIDHGRLVVPNGHWTVKDLNSDGSYENRLLGMLYNDPSGVANAMILASEEAKGILSGVNEVAEWAKNLTQNVDESESFNKFIKERIIKAPTRIAERYALC